MTTQLLASKLADKVWFTRKAWIHAEERFLKNEHHTQLLMVVYAAYTTCLSVVLLSYTPEIPNDKKLIDTGLAVLSIILLALSLYLNSKAFKDRAARFKVGYHDLDGIENSLKAIAESTVSGGSDEFVQLANKYNKILREVENHHELDDIRNRIVSGAGLTSRHPTKIEVRRYWWWRIWRFAALSIAYTAPAAIVWWFIIK